MTAAKKLVFGVLFILIFTGYCYALVVYFAQPYQLLSLSLSDILPLITLTALLVGAGALFCVFVTLAFSWRYVVPIIVLASFAPVLVLTLPTALIYTACFILSLTLLYLSLNHNLTTYLSFEPTRLLRPSIGLFITLITLVSAAGYYLAVYQNITEKGFQLPEPLVDAVISASMPTEMTVTRESSTQMPTFTPEQIQMIKDNPQTLAQFGLTAKDVDAYLAELAQPQPTNNPDKNLLKTVIKKKLDDMILPYTKYIPLILAAMFFITVKSLASLVTLLVTPFIWLIFWLLNKTGITKYTVETREVKKLVV